MPSILDLSPEIIAQIVDLIQQSSPKTLYSLSELSADFCKAVAYSQYHTSTFDTHHVNTRLKNIEDNYMWRAIRCIRVKGIEKTDGRYGDTTWRHLYKSLPKMTGLRDVKVDFIGNYVGRDLLEALEHQPGIRLYANVMFDDTPSKESILALLQNNSKLYSISVEFDDEYANCDKVTKALKTILLTCPQLRHLKLNISTFEDPDIRNCGLGFINNERPPALEILELDGYPFRDQEEYDWADSFDWSEMKRLRTIYTGIISRCLHKFTSLKEITLNPYDDDLRAAKRFFALVPSTLESIKVPFIGVIGIEGILRHGSKLRILHIYLRYSFASLPSGPNSSMDAGDLQCIKDSCPHLEELALRISHPTMWTEDTLNILTSFPKLHTLELHFELDPLLYTEDGHSVLDLSIRDDTVRKFFTPFMTISTIQQLFKYFLQTKSGAQTSALRELRVEYRILGGRGEQWEDWLEDWSCKNDISFQCKLSERDVDKNRGMFSVICKELSEKENAIFQEALSSHRDLAQILGDENQIKVVNRKFKIAWYGPLPRKDRKSWRARQSKAYGIFKKKDNAEDIIVLD